MGRGVEGMKGEGGDLKEAGGLSDYGTMRLWDYGTTGLWETVCYSWRAELHDASHAIDLPHSRDCALSVTTELTDFTDHSSRSSRPSVNKSSQKHAKDAKPTCSHL